MAKRGSRFGWLLCFSLVAGFALPVQADMENYPTARLRMLDKVTARTSTFDVKVGETVRFGQLYIKPRACRKAPPIEKPESAAFLQIWDVTPAQKAEWIFSGWMFGSSPALSGMDHPIYDVWVLDCIGTPPSAASQIAFSSSGQVGFTSGVTFTSAGTGAAAFTSSQVGYASSGQIGFASSPAAAGNAISYSSGDDNGQVEFDSSTATGAIGYTSGSVETAPAAAPADVTPADSDDTEDMGPQIAVPGQTDNGMPSPDSDTGGVDKPQNGQSDEVAPSSIQNPIY
jgi:hypothetical protein